MKRFAVVSVLLACAMTPVLCAGETKVDEAGTSTRGQEPSIIQVQEAAIRYAEVQPQKIADWRRQAAKKAWLPEVSIGVNNDITDLWHWECGSTTRDGDDVLRQGKAPIEWDIGLTWDLGELVWNADQTSIDARSRLMVELRQDVLEQVTKYYFERLRLLLELEGPGTADKKRKEKELRVRELAAHLDGLTGGFYSRKTGN
ncbi:MAG: hypothetical protein PHT59_07170 [Candidatus Omnitrophica bacterium]|nr:hypothetical protein [Candidatus Omnitrophota bacterium]